MTKTIVRNLEGLLAKALDDEIEIVDQNTKLLTAPGEHYGSVMTAVDVKIKSSTGKLQSLNLVAKQIPANEMLRVAFDIQVTFKKEVFAYVVTVPTLDEFQKKYNFSDSDLVGNLFPKCYGARISLKPSDDEVDEDAVLLFENLKILNYRNEDRLVGVDYEAAKLIVEDLGRFHAVPLALKLLHPREFQEKVMPSLVKNKGLETLPEEVGLAFHNSIMEGAFEVEELQPYLKRLQEIVDYAAEHPFVDFPEPKHEYGTICHSDFWLSNVMLLKNNQGKPIKNKIVDLQLCRYRSGLCDLVFFMFTSIINNVLDEHINDFIKFYYDSFVKTLKCFKIDLDAYSWDKFKLELDEVAKGELYHILVMLKPICTERDKVKNSSENFQNSDWSRKDLLGPSHRKKLKNTVLALAKNHWL